jgi:hypothetical protein
VLELMAGCGITLTAPNSGSAARCETLVAPGKAIDAMAFVITGDPEYYYAGHHSIVHCCKPPPK